MTRVYTDPRQAMKMSELTCIRTQDLCAFRGITAELKLNYLIYFEVKTR